MRPVEGEEETNREQDVNAFTRERVKEKIGIGPIKAFGITGLAGQDIRVFVGDAAKWDTSNTNALRKSRTSIATIWNVTSFSGR